MAAHANAEFLRQPFLRDHSRRHAHRRLARGRTATAARVADAVFLPVGVVGMAGTERVGEFVVVLRARVDIADQQRDRRAGGAAFVDAGQNLDRIRLMALGRVATRAGRAAFEVRAKIFRRDRKPRRAAIDHAADRRAVAFAEGRDGQKFPERVAGHSRSARAHPFVVPANAEIQRLGGIEGTASRHSPGRRRLFYARFFATARIASACSTRSRRSSRNTPI